MEWTGCDLCGADDTVLVFHATDTNTHLSGVFSIVQCCQCHLVYLNPRPDQHEIQRYYPENEYFCFEMEAEPPRLGQDDPLLRVIRELDLAVTSLCDVGCGTGRFLLAAQRTGWQVAGIEPHDRARGLCNARLDGRVVFSSFERARFPAGAFDVVTFWHALEHLPSPRAALGECHRILRTGGLLALAVPNFQSLERRVWGANWIGVMAPTHLFHFTRSTLRRYLETSGFEIVAESQPPGANSLAANVLRSLRRLFLDPLSKAGDGSRGSPSAGTGIGAEKQAASHYAIAGSTKARALWLTTRFVYPLAWLVAQSGLGPELRLYARKA